MGKARPRYDLSFWNLDFLEFHGDLPASGDLKPVRLPVSPADRVRLLDTVEIAVLSQQGTLLELLLPETGHRLELARFAESDGMVDLTVSGKFLYLYRKGRGEILRLTIHAGKISEERRWALGTANSASFTRLAVSHTPSSGQPPVAYLAPTPRGEILAVRLSDPPEMRVLPSPEGSPGLDDTVHLCADPLSKTLFVTEPAVQRISEVDGETGSSTVCWTPRTPVPLHTFGESFDIRRSRPRALAIYRTQKLIPEAVLRPNSRVVLTSDPRRIKPRTLLIADEGNLCVWKLVQFPDSALILDLRGRNELLSFLGSGNPPQKTQNYYPTQQEREDLRKYNLPPPVEISVSESGSILVSFGPEFPMLLLRPATAVAQDASRKGAKNHRLDES